MRIKQNLKIFLVFIFIFGVISKTLFSVPSSNGQKKYSLKKVFHQPFEQPLAMVVYPEKIDNRDYFAVAEKKGIVYLVPVMEQDSKTERIVFFDLRSQICSDGYEQGLLGMAFDPDYAKSRQMYIYYSGCTPSATYLARITVSHIKKTRSPEFKISVEKILTIDQPYANHNGGQIEFGPDGYLYLGVGDGGSGGDPHNYAQNKTSLLGKILRLDVHTARGYNIPQDNPFGGNERAEIFAYGMRNPWRFSIDHLTGWIWVGDVGQDLYEEISIVKKGANYGWRIMEGMHCFLPKKNCSSQGLVLPVHEYSHSDGESVIGGYVYHGSALAELNGKYIFGDYISGKIWYIDAIDKFQKKSTLLIDSDLFISSFAVDSSGEIYVLDILGGYIFKII